MMLGQTKIKLIYVYINRFKIRRII